MINSTPIDIIFVPQGAEYRAVCQGLNFKSAQKPTVFPIPIGCQSLNTYLQNCLDKPPKTALLMGLCGGLSPQHRVGEIVIYSGCSYLDQDNTLLWQECDPSLVRLLQERLQEKAKLVKGLTSDSIIESALQKQDLYQQYNMDVVDMEGFAALKNLSQAGIKVAIIRVISDESGQNLPNLTTAINTDGSLNPIALSRSMIQKPLAAIQLIQGSLKSLQVLQNLTQFVVAL